MVVNILDDRVKLWIQHAPSQHNIVIMNISNLSKIYILFQFRVPNRVILAMGGMLGGKYQWDTFLKKAT